MSCCEIWRFSELGSDGVRAWLEKGFLLRGAMDSQGGRAGERL